MAEEKGSSLLTGLVLGAALGAGITFLFGTKKGKEIRENIRDQYPEVFDKLGEAWEDTKETLNDRYQDVLDEVEKVKEEVGDMGGSTKSLVAKRVNDLGEAVESLGEKIQQVSAPKPMRFKKGNRRL